MDPIYEYIALDTFFGPDIPVNIFINLPSDTYAGSGSEGGLPGNDVYENALFIHDGYYLTLDGTNFMALT